MDAQRQSLRIVKAENVAQVLATSEVKFEVEVVAPITAAIQRLRQYAFTRFLVPTVDHIVMSEGTVRYLFGALHDIVSDRSKYDRILRSAGLSIGFSFGSNFMSFLRQDGLFPNSLSVLLSIWTEYDSCAGWGTFRFELNNDNNTIAILLDKNFLRRSLSSDIHRHCGFIEAYLTGLLWTIIPDHVLWANSELGGARVVVTPKEIGERKDVDCIFTVKLSPTDIPLSLSDLSVARSHFFAGDLTQCRLSLRTALENGFKQKVDFDQLQPGGKYIGFTQLVKAYSSANVLPEEFSLGKIRDLYAELSKSAHQTGETFDKNSCFDQLVYTSQLVLSIDHLTVGENKRDLLKTRLVATSD